MIWLKRCITALCGLAGLITPAAASDGGLAGRWRSPDLSGIVEIYQCGAAYCGRIVGGAFNPDMRDTRNRNPALRNRTIQGLLIMTGFVGGPPSWTGGRIYRPLDGGTYSGSITLVGGNALHLKGCIVWPLCRTQTWHRIP